jgi:DNA-3-methyladenine glycosylase
MLAREFFARDALVVARALVGTRIVHGEKTARIVETEAYRGPRDLACHARAGLTKRTRTLFGAPGHAYVFLIYGMYDCFNVVCKGEGAGHAVLIRAAEIEHHRADGPGRFARAMGFTRAHDGESLMTKHLHLMPRDRRVRIGVSARVGVQYAGEWADAKYRFFDALSPHVSKPSPRQIGRGLVKAKPR